MWLENLPSNLKVDLLKVETPSVPAVLQLQ